MTAYFAVPGDIDIPSGGYAYARRLIAECEAAGEPLRLVPLPGGFPFPDAAALAETARRIGKVPDGSSLLFDGLALGALDDLAERESLRLRLVALVHHPLALETGLHGEVADRLGRSEMAALAAAAAVIATSRTTAACLARDFAVPEEKIAVAPPGTDPAAMAEPGHHPARLVSVGSVIPRKGHDLLVEALSRLARRAWTCTIIGSTEIDPAWSARLGGRVRALGLAGRIAFAGTLPDPRSSMADADLFVLPSRYEGYGMAFAEALSQGLPVIGCAAGAVPEVVPPQAGILVPPDDVDALAEALAALLDDPALLRACAEGARLAGAALPSWRDSAAIVRAVLDGLER